MKFELCYINSDIGNNILVFYLTTNTCDEYELNINLCIIKLNFECDIFYPFFITRKTCSYYPLDTHKVNAHSYAIGMSNSHSH